jgi:RNA polymerase sigma-70 factor (ECF subfamily)
VSIRGPERDATAGFDTFADTTGAALRRALVSCYGVEIGVEAAADAMRVAWERWPEVSTMANPAGFLFRVGQSHARPHVRWSRRSAHFPVELGSHPMDAAPAVIDLLRALGRLRPEERAAVVLVKSHGYSYREVAELLGVSEAAVTNHVHRSLQRLRPLLEVHE